MPATTHPEFNAQTEGLDVAKAFADGIRGRTIVITGVNRGGIGFSTSQAYASQSPAHLIITGRNVAKIQASIDALKAEYPNVDYRPLKMDLSSQKSVRAAAAELLSWDDVPVVNIVVNSAGVMLLPERILSEDGIEMHFATNHIGHFLFTVLILPKLIKAAQKSPKGATRVINVSSGGPMVSDMRWSDINFEKKTKDLPESERPDEKLHRAWAETDIEDKAYLPLAGYNQSKLANLLFSIGLTDRVYEKYGVLSLAIHPGAIPTELDRNFTPAALEVVRNMVRKFNMYKTLGAGASTSLVAALDPKLGPGEPKDGKENYGSFLSDCQINEKARPASVSSEEAKRLWDLSEKLVGEKFDW